MPGSIFNENVSGWAVDGSSSEFANDIVNDYKADYGAVGVNFSNPIYDVPAGTPDSTISVRSGCNDFTASTGTEIPVPSSVDTASSSDSPMFLYSPSLNKMWEFWEFERSGSGYSACWGGSASLSSFNGVFSGGYGEAASGISYLATTISEADIASGSINHAIAFIVPNCNGSVYPADRTDCGSVPGQPGEGQWFRFPSSLAMPSGLSPFAQMVFRAIQQYGMVITDHGGSVSLAAEQTSDWSAEGHSGTDPITASMSGLQEYQVVASLPWSSLQAVDPPGH